MRLSLESFRLNLEKELLGACFFDRDAFKDISAKLSKKDFKYKHHKIIFETFEYLNLLNAPINVTNVKIVLMDKNKLEEVGGVEYLLQLSESVKNTNNLDIEIDLFKRLSIKDECKEPIEQKTWEEEFRRDGMFKPRPIYKPRFDCMLFNGNCYKCLHCNYYCTTYEGNVIYVCSLYNRLLEESRAEERK